MTKTEQLQVLKAKAYDILAAIQGAQATLIQVNQQIADLQAMPEAVTNGVEKPAKRKGEGAPAAA